MNTLTLAMFLFSIGALLSINSVSADEQVSTQSNGLLNSKQLSTQPKATCKDEISSNQSSDSCPVPREEAFWNVSLTETPSATVENFLSGKSSRLVGVDHRFERIVKSLSK